MLHANFCPCALSSMPPTRLGRRFVAQPDLHRGCLVDRLLHGFALRRRKVERGADQSTVARRLQRVDETLAGRALKRAQANDEQPARARFKTFRGEVGQRLASDCEHFGLSSLSQRLAEILRVAHHRLATRRRQRVGCLTRVVHHLLALDAGFVGRLRHQDGPLPIEYLVLLLERVAICLRRSLLLFGIGELRGDALLARVDGVEHRLVEEALHQPDEDDEVQRLRADGEPVDQHGLLSGSLGRLASAAFQNGLAKIRIIDTTKQ